MAKTKKEVQNFQITFTIGNDVYNSSGKDFIEAMSKIKPTNFGKGLGSIYVKTPTSETKIPIKLTSTKMQRIFAKPVDLALFAKKINTLL